MKLTIPPSAAGMRLTDYFNQNGISHNAPCAGNGVCGKCLVTLLKGSLCRPDGTPLAPDAEGRVLACRAVLTETGAEILLEELHAEDVSARAERGEGRATEEKPYERLGVALDIGTTTLAAALLDLSSGETLMTASRLNPQSGFGADVMSRIEACGKGDLDVLTHLLRRGISNLIGDLYMKMGREFIAQMKGNPHLKEMTVAGNPTMLHILCGESPVGMGQYPFTPVFLETKRLSGKAVGLVPDFVTLLPSASAFVGADVVGGAALAGLGRGDKTALLLDIGTNGEMILARKGKLYATSCAAGPALEGAGISCGMGGVAGAVSSVSLVDGEIRYKTVGDMPPRGLSGSGLVDLAAVLLEKGILDESGALEEDYRLVGRQAVKDGVREEMPTRVTLTGSDVRALQLVKSAFRAGVETLLSVAGLTPEDLDRVYLAGGLGYYMNPKSAARIGLLPEAFLDKAEVLGNASLQAATAVLGGGDSLSAMEELAARCETVELNEQPLFSELFIAYMCFE